MVPLDLLDVLIVVMCFFPVKCCYVSSVLNDLAVGIIFIAAIRPIMDSGNFIHRFKSS